MNMPSEIFAFANVDGQTETKEPRSVYFNFLSLTPQNSYTVNVYCCRLLFTKGQRVIVAPLGVGVSLVGLRWYAVIRAILVVVAQGVTEMNDTLRKLQAN
jgi:hypothetical protein